MLDSNSHRIPAALRALCLKLHLIERAEDLCSGVSEAELVTKGASEVLAGKKYQQDALLGVFKTFWAFYQLCNTCRNTTESTRSFESRFSAQVANFKSTCTTKKLPECFTALTLLTSFATDGLQRVSVMAPARPSDATLNSQSSNDKFLKAFTYQSAALVLKRCERSSQLVADHGLLTGSSASIGGFDRNRHKKTISRPVICVVSSDIGNVITTLKSQF